MYSPGVPLSPMRDQLAKVVLAHERMATLANGITICRCKLPFKTDLDYADHVAQRAVDALDEVLQQARVDGQLTVLAAAMRYFGPSERGATSRSRAVYTGAQFAGWCRERAHSLSRTSGQGKPPTND